MTSGDETRDPRSGSEPADQPITQLHPLELALRHGLRYSGLREAVLDERMLLYIPLAVCERELVVPLAVAGDVLEVATAYHDPDLELLDERFPDLAVELVLAPAERIAELQAELRAAV